MALIGCVFTSSSAFCPAAADSGFALNVPLWPMRDALLKPGSSLSWIMSMISALPVTAPPGSPPPSILASVHMSGVTPYSSCAPPLDMRNPVTTSSKISTTPYRSVTSRNSPRKLGLSGVSPMCAPVGSTMTAATSGSPASVRSTSAMSFGSMEMTVLAVSAGMPPPDGSWLRT